MCIARISEAQAINRGAHNDNLIEAARRRVMRISAEIAQVLK
jgi:hypothetical protein